MTRQLDHVTTAIEQPARRIERRELGPNRDLQCPGSVAMPRPVRERLDIGRSKQRPASAAGWVAGQQPATHVGVDGLALDSEPPRDLRRRHQIIRVAAHIDAINVNRITVDPGRWDGRTRNRSHPHELPNPPRRRRVLAPFKPAGVMNTNLASQLDATTLGARLWRIAPGQASTRHRHFKMDELYVLLEGTGRIRVGENVHTLEPLSSVLVEPDEIRQLFNDTGSDQLWLITGAPPENADGIEMSPEQALAWTYPDGPKALPPTRTRPTRRSCRGDR